MREWILGRHPIYETLRAKRRHCFQLLVAQNTQPQGRLQEIINLCSQARIPLTFTPRSHLDSLGDNHQGVALQVSAYPYVTLPDLLKSLEVEAKNASETPFLLVLDTLQDPQNLGTLLRTAEAVKVHGVLLPLRHTVTITPAVVSASSGASEHLLIAQANLAQALHLLKQRGVWIIGLDQSEGAVTPDEVDFSLPLALVVGNENRGIRPLIRKTCDILLKLPMRGRVESLNAAVAGSIALYLVWQRRGF